MSTHAVFRKQQVHTASSNGGEVLELLCVLDKGYWLLLLCMEVHQPLTSITTNLIDTNVWTYTEHINTISLVGS